MVPAAHAVKSALLPTDERGHGAVHTRRCAAGIPPLRGREGAPSPRSNAEPSIWQPRCRRVRQQPGLQRTLVHEAAAVLLGRAACSCHCHAASESTMHRMSSKDSARFVRLSADTVQCPPAARAQATGRACLRTNSSCPQSCLATTHAQRVGVHWHGRALLPCHCRSSRRRTLLVLPARMPQPPSHPASGPRARASA